MEKVVNVSNSNYRGCRTSALELSKKCPFAVQKIYRDKLEGYIDYSAIRGSVIHDCLEDYGKHCISNGYSTDLEYWDSIINKYAAKVPIEIFQETLDILIDIREFINFSLFVDAKYSSIEERFYLDYNLEYINNPTPEDIENAFFSSAIDSYFIEQDNETCNVFDYKSSRKIYNNTVLKTKLQKDYYPLLIFKKFENIKTVNFFFDFVRYGHVTNPITYTREDIPRLEKLLYQDILNYHEIVNTEHDMPAQPSSFCILCGVQGICPAVKNAFSDEIFISNTEKAVLAARQIKIANIKIKQMKENLETFINKNGNINISELEGYGIQETEKESVFNLYHLVEELKKENVPPGKIYDSLKLSKAAYLKLIKNTTIPKDKFLESKKGTKTGFFDLECDSEEDSQQEE